MTCLNLYCIAYFRCVLGSVIYFKNVKLLKVTCFVQCVVSCQSICLFGVMKFGLAGEKLNFGDFFRFFDHSCVLVSLQEGVFWLHHFISTSCVTCVCSRSLACSRSVQNRGKTVKLKGDGIHCLVLGLCFNEILVLSLAIFFTNPVQNWFSFYLFFLPF